MNDKQSHEDHTRAAIYFELRAAIEALGEKEVEAIVKQAKADVKGVVKNEIWNKK